MDPKLSYPIPEGVNKHSFTVEKTARWFHIGASPKSCSHIIIVLHGYAHHPAYMLGGISELAEGSDTLCVCAPEGLSRFYIKGFDGRVGASWMTRDDRQQDITDQISYLESWWASLGISPETKVTLAGFSQGVATACRWLSGSRLFTPSRVILHSGTIPPEWLSKAPKLPGASKNFVLIRGDIDTIYPKESHSEAATFLSSLGLNVETIEVQGSHKIKAEHLTPYL